MSQTYIIKKQQTKKHKNTKSELSYHRASELLRQFPVVGFRESWGDQLCMSEDLRVLEAHSSPRLRSVGFIHQGEHRLLRLQR